jgi:hypothetical protein
MRHRRSILGRLDWYHMPDRRAAARNAPHSCTHIGLRCRKCSWCTPASHLPQAGGAEAKAMLMHVGSMRLATCGNPWTEQACQH